VAKFTVPLQTNAWDQVIEWQSRPLDAMYPIVYLDCIVVKVRQDKRVINKSIFLALGINLEGHKELMGLWIAENEGAKFWLGGLTELQQRGIDDILNACVDGLKGFPDAINAVYPDTHVQLCIVHMVRNSLNYVSWKDYKEVTSELKRIDRQQPKMKHCLSWTDLATPGMVIILKSASHGEIIGTT
jgi:putative transposase